MITPQQIDQISFSNAVFNGYDKQSVDEILGPLTEDYVTLYKENALLKSKMRVLVTKLEEYRANEASMKDAIINAQKTCDKMVKEAEVKCTQMLNDANAAAAENARNADARIAEEAARVEEARRAAAAKINDLEEQLKGCIQTLERIKQANPAKPQAEKTAESKPVYDFDGENAAAGQPGGAPAEDDTDAVANEIAFSLEALVGTTGDDAPKAEPKHPRSDTSTSARFANLQFGRNYDPTSHR
ncbi:MAG: DivIVA domain-containing protein [Firmicutes bacterium]|nr:DivIVA domain-containing protein [Bacillota bacterium]